MDLRNLGPTTIHLIEDEDKNPHWHECPELIFILSGEMLVHYRNSTYKLAENDMILMNTFDFHSCQFERVLAVGLQLHFNQLGVYAEAYETETLDCNSAISESKKQFQILKRTIISFLQSCEHSPAHHQLMNASYTNKLLYELINNFKVSYDDSVRINKDQREHIKSALFYMNSNYKRKITLNEIAAYANCSPTYFSALFKNILGISFSESLTNIRLSNALNDLTNAKYSIESIATKQGFPNTTSFVKIFKKRYQMLPSQYRLLAVQNRLSGDSIAGFSSKQTQLLDSLQKYEQEDVFIGGLPRAVKKMEVSAVYVNHKGKLLRNNFRTVFPKCNLADLLYNNMQQMVKSFQEEMHFHYLLLEGIFREDFGIYSEYPYHDAIYNFTKIDSIIEFLLSINLKPIIDLGGVPKAMAEPTSFVSFYGYGFGKPVSLEKWNSLICGTIQHFIKIFGRKEVESWKFYTWMNPTFPYNTTTYDNPKDFFQFYETTYRAVKSYSANISFGTPLLDYTAFTAEKDWFIQFHTYCSIHSCEPDHIYFSHYLEEQSTRMDGRLHIEHKNTSQLKQDISTIKKVLKGLDWDTKELWMLEWGATRCRNEVLNDTVFNAAYIVNTLLQNYDTLMAYSYASLCDLPMFPYQISKLFYGDIGLNTHNGIKKASYKAFILLHRLGSHLLYQEPGCFVTKDNASIQVVLYNYQPSVAFASSELLLDREHGFVPLVKEMDGSSQDSLFTGKFSLKIELPLKGLSEAKYHMTEIILNDKSGCTYEKWKELGAYPLYQQEDVPYLNQVSACNIYRQEIYPISGSFQYVRELKPYEVRYMVMNQVDYDAADETRM